MTPNPSRIRRDPAGVVRARLKILRWWCFTGIRDIQSVFSRLHPVVHAIGDSHVKFNFGGNPRIRVCYLGPVTMHRIARDGRNALSLKGLAIYREDIVVWGLGEIDVRCHLVNQRDLRQEPMERIVDSLARDYLNSVATLQAEIDGLKTVILAVIPPTDQVHNENFPKIGSLEERIDARNLLNAALEKYCPPNGFTYLDPYGPFEDSSGGLKAEMSDGNVHCGPAYAPLIVEKVMDTCVPWLGSTDR
jgi:hypothetical protein